MTIKDQKEKSRRIYSAPKLSVPLPSALPPLSPLYLYPGAQISTVGSVKPFFPSFTSTGFSVRVCQTRICVSRQRHETTWSRPPDLTPPSPCSRPHSASISPAPSHSAIVSSRFSLLFFISTYPLTVAVCTYDAFKIAAGNRNSAATENSQINLKISSCFSSSPASLNGSLQRGRKLFKSL